VKAPLRAVALCPNAPPAENGPGQGGDPFQKALRTKAILSTDRGIGEQPAVSDGNGSLGPEPCEPVSRFANEPLADSRDIPAATVETISTVRHVTDAAQSTGVDPSHPRRSAPETRRGFPPTTGSAFQTEVRTNAPDRPPATGPTSERQTLLGAARLPSTGRTRRIKLSRGGRAVATFTVRSLGA
jgi:hypothetical protein